MWIHKWKYRHLIQKCFKQRKWKWKSLSRVQLFVTPWNSPGQNTEVDSLSLLQGFFPTQGLNPGLLHGRRILYQVSHKESPTVRKFCNKLNWHWISLALKADVRGGKQRIVSKVKENRNYLSLTWLTVLSVMWCHIIVSKSGDGSQFL